MKFAAVGFTCIDIYKNLGISYPTGNGVDLLFNLLELSPEITASLVSAVGEDMYAHRMASACTRRGVNIDHLRVVPGGQTAIIEMLLNGRDRVHHRAMRGVMQTYQPSGEEMDFIRAQDMIHTDLSWNVANLLSDMRKRGTKIYFDFSKRHDHPDVEKVLKNIDYGIFSFPKETEYVRDLLLWGCSLGAKTLLATFGENGSIACDGKNFYRQACIPAKKLVNTVGAGDAYGAGFLSGILGGFDVAKSMLLGARRASEIVSIFAPYPGAQE